MVTLLLGDCLELLPDACPEPAVIVTDPPYGTGARGYLQGGMSKTTRRHKGASPVMRIMNDLDTSARDAVLALYPDTPAVVFGSPLKPAPANAVQALVMVKPPDAGTIAARGGWRRDIELVYLCGPWPRGAPVRSSVIRTAARSQGGTAGVPGRYGHPHAKPLDVLCGLIAACPPGLILDPFAGSGTTLLAARLMDRDALGIEIDPEHHATATRHLAEELLPW